ncbi:MAG: hypothetical protein NT129_03820 [Candidatus Aenigmarchaeota archaeon]|nr:hypothetical protein [Candidatus Aenigmarchaeota archaeon]
MKGIDLPINAIVIVAIAVLVLVVIAAFFVGVVGPGTGSMNSQNAWNTGCAQARARGCLQADFGVEGEPLPIAGYDPEGDGTANNIMDACEAVYGYTEGIDCRNACCGSPQATSPVTPPAPTTTT